MIFNDNYELLSGWIHDYYCDKDGSGLIFDINNSNYFECPLCHYKYTDEKRKRAWVTKCRYKIFDKLEKYATNYSLNKNKKHLKYIEEVLEYYSLNYNKFSMHDKTGKIFNNYANVSNKCGKITAQGLNEAMIAIQIINCIENVGKYIKRDIKQNVFNSLFPQIYELLKPQINRIHNIACYEMCAIGMMGILSNNINMINYAFDSKYSFYNQLNKGVTKDYFWFEGSFHYHLFVLKPILQLLKITKKYNYNVPTSYYDIARKMLRQAYKCSFSDCTLPSPNDGWPNRHLSNYVKIFELGNQLFLHEFDEILKMLKIKVNNTGTIHLLNTGFSILKNECWNIFMKYKDNDYGHAHPDKLNLEIKLGNYFLTHDLSTSGYGTSISKEFYKKTYSHNSIVINGKDQYLECKSIVKSYDEDLIDVDVINVYNNIDISRKIKLTYNKINDRLIVKNGKNNNVDFFFHCDAELITKLDGCLVTSLKDYPYLKNVKEIFSKSNNIILEWNLNGRKVFSKIDLKNKKLYICKSPDNPNSRERTTLLIRNVSDSKNILFQIKWIAY